MGQSAVMGQSAFPLLGGGTAEAHAGQFQEACEQGVAEGRQRIQPTETAQTFVGLLQGLNETRSQDDRLGASPQPAFLSAADLGEQPNAATTQQQANPPGSPQLVGRAAEQIHAEGVGVHQPVTHHLHRIDMQGDAGTPAQATHRLQGLKRAHLALAPDQRHQAGGGLQKFMESHQVDHAAVIHRQPRHLPALPPQRFGRCDGGGMLHRRDHQPPGGNHPRLPQQRQVNRLTRTGAENQIVLARS